MMTINERIKQLRKSLGLTQSEFGERIGVNRGVIVNLEIEGRRAKIDDMIIRSISREFNVNEDWLRTGEGEMYVPLDQEDKLMAFLGSIAGDEPDSSRKKFMRMLAQLDMDDWDNLDAIMDKMLEHEKPGD